MTAALSISEARLGPSPVKESDNSVATSPTTCASMPLTSRPASCMTRSICTG